MSNNIMNPLPLSMPSANDTLARKAHSQKSLDAQFLNVLVLQLKKQDPTSPTDPAALASQMMSFAGFKQQQGMQAALLSIQESVKSIATGLQVGATK